MCECCLLLAPINARGLCVKCYSVHQYRGTLGAYPRRFRRLADVLEDWEIYRARGMSLRQASVEMGYAPKSLERILARARSRAGSVA